MAISDRPMDAKKRPLTVFLRPSTSFHEIKKFCQDAFGEVPVNRVMVRFLGEGYKGDKWSDRALTPGNCSAMLQYLADRGDKAMLVLQY